MAGGLTTTAWFPEDAIIKIEKRGTGSIQTITTEVSNYSDGGGDKNVESVAHFGGAFLIVKKPQEVYKVEFDVSQKDTKWADIISSDVTEIPGSFRVVRSGGDQTPFKLKMEWLAPDSQEAFKILYYNAYGVTYSKDNKADDRLTAKLAFTMAPTSNVGSAQKLELETVNRSNAGIGSSATGSYGYWEKTYDTIHGYAAGSML
jgi:hypothetical protein